MNLLPHTVLDLYTMPVIKNFQTLDTLLPVYNILKEKQCYEPLFLNVLAPTIPRDPIILFKS